MTNIEMQNLNRFTMEYARATIKSGMSLIELRELCGKFMLQNGADSFWYWGVGAFVFSGDETTISVSGKDYVTSGKKIEENDIITIDLSPQKNNVWGDFARTIIIQQGKVVTNKDDRIYTERGNKSKLSDVMMFTFEPHISLPNSKWGYKREDIYYFQNGKLVKA